MAEEAIEEKVAEEAAEVVDEATPEVEKVEIEAEEVTQDTAEETKAEEETTIAVDGTMEVHYIDVGQGDSTLIKCNGHSLLIDAGDNSKGTTVQLYLKKQGVESLDAVIWTHPDADHIGGADVIVTKYDIGTIYQTSLSFYFKVKDGFEK